MKLGRTKRVVKEVVNVHVKSAVGIDRLIVPSRLLKYCDASYDGINGVRLAFAARRFAPHSRLPAHLLPLGD